MHAIVAGAPKRDSHRWFVTMICALCKTQVPLCRSHIIPEFCFKCLYDGNHHYINMYDVRNDKTCLGQKGFYEPMLCTQCEAKFTRYERHSRRIFTDPLPPPRKGTTRFFDLPNVDAFKFRYFLLSVLWRASNARQKIFQHVDLGPRHHEILRQHLLSETLPPYNRYGCWVLSLHYDDTPLKDFVVEPTYCRIEGHKVYRFVFTGIVLMCFVSNHSLSERWSRLLLGSSDHVTIYRADLPELAFLRKVWYGK